VDPIPFTLRQSGNEPVTFVYLVHQLNGLVGADDDGLVLQYVESRHRYTAPAKPPEESQLREVRIPFAALRRVELRRGLFRTRLVLAAADLRAFEPFKVWLRQGELALAIPRGERSAAADLASSVELALSTRLLASN